MAGNDGTRSHRHNGRRTGVAVVLTVIAAVASASMSTTADPKGLDGSSGDSIQPMVRVENVTEEPSKVPAPSGGGIKPVID